MADVRIAEKQTPRSLEMPEGRWNSYFPTNNSARNGNFEFSGDRGNTARFYQILRNQQKVRIFLFYDILVCDFVYFTKRVHILFVVVDIYRGTWIRVPCCGYDSYVTQLKPLYIYISMSPDNETKYRRVIKRFSLVERICDDSTASNRN